MKKPGLFARKKPIHAKIYWMHNTKGGSVRYNIYQLQGRDRNTGRPLPIYATGCMVFCFSGTTGARSMVETLSKLYSRPIQKDAVLLYKGDLVNIQKSDLAYRLGDAYNQKVLTEGTITFTNHIKRASHTMVDKIADIFSDALQEFVSNELGLYMPSGIANITYLGVDNDIKIIE